MPEPTARAALRERLGDALHKAAYVCPGDSCTLTEDECQGEHGITLISIHLSGAREIAWIEGNTDAIADALAPVVEEALAEQTRALAAQIALYKSAENDVTDLMRREDRAETERAALADRNRDLDAQLTRERQRRLAAEAAIRRVLPALDSAHSTLVTSPRDQGAARDTAWLYGIFVGWDPEKSGETEGAMAELAARHRWHPEDVERLRELRNAVSALRAALDADQPKETP